MAVILAGQTANNMGYIMENIIVIKEKTMNINKAITNLRKKHKLSQSEFANKVGISVSTVKKIDINYRMPNSITRAKICNAFNVGESDLFKS